MRQLQSPPSSTESVGTHIPSSPSERISLTLLDPALGDQVDRERELPPDIEVNFESSTSATRFLEQPLVRLTMTILLRVFTLVLVVITYVMCRTAETSTPADGTQPQLRLLPKFGRRMLTPPTLLGISTNRTLRAQFCATCRTRNCQRRALIRRCSIESSIAKKCACCNFCPEKWRLLRSTDRPVKDWTTGGGLEEIIGVIQKKLPPETARACQQHKVKCSSAQICLLNIQNLPVCRCLPEEACGRGTKDTIVCAANGFTYLSRCHLLVAACRLKEKLRPHRPGQCHPGDAKLLLAEQVRVPFRRKELRRRKRTRFGKRRGKRRRYEDRLLQLIASNQRERRRLLREMKRFRRLQRRRVVGMPGSV